jgi:hypothetical protein
MIEAIGKINTQKPNVLIVRKEDHFEKSTTSGNIEFKQTLDDAAEGKYHSISIKDLNYLPQYLQI